MNKKIVISIILGGIVLLGGSFYAGTKYTGANKSPNENFTNQVRGNQNSGIGIRGAQGLSGMTMGEIIAKDDKSITVKLPSGGSKIVFFTDKTTVIKNITGSILDLVVNENVVINGSTNTDGSINAQNIQLGSEMPGFRQTQNLPTSN